MERMEKKTEVEKYAGKFWGTVTSQLKGFEFGNPLKRGAHQADAAASMNRGKEHLSKARAQSAQREVAVKNSDRLNQKADATKRKSGTQRNWFVRGSKKKQNARKEKLHIVESGQRKASVAQARKGSGHNLQDARQRKAAKNQFESARASRDSARASRNSQIAIGVGATAVGGAGYIASRKNMSNREYGY